MFTTLVSLLTVVFLAFGGSVATAYAAQDDLPGDALYSVKVFTEDARLALANDAQDITLYEEFSQRRVQETVQLTDGSRFEDVEAAMLRYETQLQAMNQTLTRLAEKDPAQADALAARIQTMLETQVQTLAQLRQRVTDPARGSIDAALTQSRERAGIEFVGLVESITPEFWMIASRGVAVTAQTEIKGNVVVGSLVKVHAYLAPDGLLTAREIELVQVDMLLDFTGYVDAISDTTWTVNGQTILLNEATDIRGDIQVGDWVVVKALLTADGGLTALVIHLPGDEGVPSNGNGSDDNGNGSDDNGNDDNGNGSDDNGNDDNGNGSDDNGNDDNGNGSDDNGNDDNENGSDDNGNDDNGNGSDDNGNDDNGNGSDDNGNDDNGNGSDDNGNDDNENGSDDNGNDDNGSDDNGNDDNGNGSDDNGSLNLWLSHMI